MADGVLQVVYPYDFGRPCQLLQNKFFDPSTPDFDQSEASKSKMAARGLKNGRRGLERGPTLGYLPFQATFAK